MIQFIVRRILSGIPTLFGVALIVFVLFHMVGGDPTYLILGKHANPQQIERVRVELGLDKPMPMQFLGFLKQIATFDYGRSYATKQPISDMILTSLGPTLSLALPSFFLTTVFSVAFALLAAAFHGRLMDRLLVVGCVFGMSISILAYILFGQYVLAYQWGWFPISGYDSDPFLKWKYLALPILIWVVVSLGYEIRFYRAAILEETKMDYVRTARAKGLSDRWVFLKHILKNSLVPIITNISIEIPLLILGSFLLEGFFQIPGLGELTIDAFRNSDFPLIKAMTVIFAVVMSLVNILTDILYKFFDPRVTLR